MADPQIKLLPLVTVPSLSATAAFAFGPFTNGMTIRRFVENCGGQSGTTPTTALSAQDGGTSGAGSTAIATKSAGALTNNDGLVTECVDVNAADGYYLAAGSTLKVTVTLGGTSPVFTGYSLVAEYVDGNG